MRSSSVAFLGVMIVVLIGVAASAEYLIPRYFPSPKVSTQSTTSFPTVTTLTGTPVPVPSSTSISTTQVNTITTAALPVECNGLQPVEGALGRNVLFMNLTSTACIVVTYVTPARGSNFVPPGGIVEPGVQILKRSCYQNSNSSGCLSYRNYTGSFTITFAPSSVNLTGFEGSPANPFSSTFSVVYLLHPLGNATGFYDMDFLAAGTCGGGNSAFAVGYLPSKINGSDLSSVVNPVPPRCYIPLCFVLSVSVADMGYESIVIPPP